VPGVGSDLGVRDPDERWSCADGWRQINDRLGPMLSDGIEYKVEATALRGYLEQHPEYTAVYAGEAGGNHWRRTTQGVRRAVPVSELLPYHERHYPTVNGVVSGTGNHFQHLHRLLQARGRPSPRPSSCS
jgi:hypothetical protein